MGFGYWSLSKYLKGRVKRAIDFMFQFERNLAQYCKKRGFDGVICGHIHHAEIKEIDGVMYMNDGDWVESMTALVEHHDGQWAIVTWTQEKDNVVDDIDSGTHKRSKGRSSKGNVGVSGSSDLRANTENNDLSSKV
jgi:4-hydroxy-3-methylbut-2-enyl diphosphate reductase IspH